ncbi:gamma-aminobutyric acid type B receptor subunit 1-like isoform X2 [Apostichopus japonicus]|uniref:gamma-aminobutyric acid type B receptor subunit 1-like isoform X2 n=1 Tax=Stichopus japonicus TaxID=307972 RepID=UPI003AB79748
MMELRVLILFQLIIFFGSGACGFHERIPIHIGGMFSISDRVWDGSGCLVAAELALEQINNRSDILPDYELRMVWNDTECEKSKMTRILFDQIFKEPQKLLLIGPGCSLEAALSIPTAQQWNLMTSNSDLMSRASEFNGTVLSEVIQHEVTNQLGNFMQENIRIIIVIAFEETTRKFFCEAYREEFYGPDFFWILPGFYRENWWLFPDDEVDCTTEELAEIVETSLALVIDVTGISKLNFTTVAGIAPSELLEEVKRRLLWPRYRGFTLNDYLAYTFDAVWSIGLMLNRTANKLKQRKSLKRLEDFTYSDDELYKLFFNGMAATDFAGASGHVAFLNGERLGGSSDISQLRGHCQEGWFLESRFCYKFFNDVTADWNQAVTSCEEKGAYLTNLASATDLKLLRDLWISAGWNETLEWNIGLRLVLHSDGTLNKTTIRDLENRTVDWQLSGDASRDCVFIDFGSNTILNAGECSEKRAFICKSKAEYSLVQVAVYSSLEDNMTWLDDIIWPGGDVPLDGPAKIPVITERVELLIPTDIYIIMTSLTGTGLVLVVVITFVILYISRRSLYEIDTVLYYDVLFSCVIMYSSVLITKSQVLPTLTDKQQLLICQVHDIAASLGFTLGVSALVGKIWFIYQAATSSGVGRVQGHVISNTCGVYVIIAGSLAVDILLVAVYCILYPRILENESLDKVVDPVDFNYVTEYYVTKCSSADDVIPFLLLFGDKALLLLVGMYLSYEVKQTSIRELPERKGVAICFYNITLFGVCGLILTFITKTTPTESFIIFSSLIICCTTITILVLCVPKIFWIMKHTTGGVNKRVNGTTSSNSQGSSVVQGTVSNTMNLHLHGNVPKELLEENARLRKQYEELQRMVHERHSHLSDPIHICEDKGPSSS